MTRRAPFKQSDVTRLAKGALKAGLPVGSFKIVVEGGVVTLLPLTANDPSDAAADAERRMRDAFGE
jgi:hypothetical protein